MIAASAAVCTHNTARSPCVGCLHTYGENSVSLNRPFHWAVFVKSPSMGSKGYNLTYFIQLITHWRERAGYGIVE